MTFGAPGSANAADGCHLPARARWSRRVDRVDEFGGGQQRVLALSIGVVPGVIREAFDRHVPPVDADDAFDDADVDLSRVQDAALLDVQLEVGRSSPGLRCACACVPDRRR